jgi:hypothetical protein
MSQNIGVEILITAKNLANNAIDSAKEKIDGVKESVGELREVLGELGIALGFAEITKSIVETNAEYQKLVGQLTVLTGSAKTAAAAFEQLDKFAGKTPFDSADWVRAFITLKNQGIDPTIETLKAFGNIAALSGENVADFTTSVQSAAEGNYRALRQFGINMIADGDHLVATFRGQKTSIGNDAKDIVDYLQQLGNTKFAGAMDEQAHTLEGSWTRLKGAAETLAISIGKAGLSKDLDDAAESMIKFADQANAVNQLTVQYTAFKIVLLTIFDALKIAAMVFIVPIVAVADTVSAVIHGIVGTVANGLGLIGTAVDAFTGGKTNIGKALNNFASGQFNSAADDFIGIKNSAKALVDDITTGLKNAQDRETQIIALAAKAQLATSAEGAGGPIAGTGLANAPSTDNTKQSFLDAERKKAHQQYIDDLTARAGVLRQYIALNYNAMDSANELARVELQLAAAVQRGNMTDQDRVKLLDALKASRDARQQAGFLSLDEITSRDAKNDLQQEINGYGMALVSASGNALLAQTHSVAKMIDDEIQKLPAIGGTIDANGRRTGGTLLPPGTNQTLAQFADGIRRAAGEGQRLDDIIGHIAVSTFESFGAATERAFAAFASGAEKGGKAFESAMLGALASVASAFGQFFMKRAEADAAAALFDLANPLTAASAAAEFEAAAGWTAAGLGMFAIAGALGGTASRVGSAGSGGASSASSANSSLSGSQGDATLVVEGGFLDMNDPRQADALANALSLLSGRRVTIKSRS